MENWVLTGYYKLKTKNSIHILESSWWVFFSSAYWKRILKLIYLNTRVEQVLNIDPESQNSVRVKTVKGRVKSMILDYDGSINMDSKRKKDTERPRHAHVCGLIYVPIYSLVVRYTKKSRCNSPKAMGTLSAHILISLL